MFLFLNITKYIYIEPWLYKKSKKKSHKTFLKIDYTNTWLWCILELLGLLWGPSMTPTPTHWNGSSVVPVIVLYVIPYSIYTLMKLPRVRWIEFTVLDNFNLTLNHLKSYCDGSVHSQGDKLPDALLGLGLESMRAIYHHVYHFIIIQCYIDLMICFSFWS